MKKFEEARDAARERANGLAIDLAKAQADLKLHLDALKRVHGWTAATMPGLNLTPLPLQNRSIDSFISFFFDLAGQLEALPDLLAARAHREGRQVVDATAWLILPCVHHLTPSFPFDALLDEFAMPEEENEATAAVEPVIDEVKEAAKHD